MAQGKRLLDLVDLRHFYYGVCVFLLGLQGNEQISNTQLTDIYSRYEENGWNLSEKRSHNADAGAGNNVAIYSPPLPNARTGNKVVDTTSR